MAGKAAVTEDRHLWTAPWLNPAEKGAFALERDVAASGVFVLDKGVFVIAISQKNVLV